MEFTMTRGIAGIMVTLFLAAFMLLTALPMAVVAEEPASSHVFIEEGAEQATFEEWNVRWEKYDQNAASSRDYWCRSQHNPHTGSYAAYCAKTGYNTHYLNQTGVQPFDVNITGLTAPFNPSDAVLRYDTDMDALMRKSFTGTQYYNTITVNFWFWSDTGNSDAKQPGTNTLVGYDFLNLVYYTGTNNSVERHVIWTDTEAQAKAKVWTEVSVIIPQDANRIAFEFVSGTTPPVGGDARDAFSAFGIRTVPQGSSGMKEGVYLDDITVVGTDPVADVPLVTQADPLPAYETSRTFPVAWSDNNPLYTPLQWIYLHYRMNGTTTWTTYKTPEKPGGGFISSPIMFTATADGTYEFFTQGYDANGTLEDWRGVADATTTVDTVAPSSSLQIMGNGQDGSYNGAVAFTLTASDAASGVDSIFYRVDGADWKVYTTNVGMTTNGPHSIEYYAKDMAGNAEAIRVVNLTITNGGSGVVFQNGNGNYPSGNVTINFAVVDTTSVSKLEYALDDGAYIALDPNATSVTLNGLSDGKHTLTIRAEDSSNNVMVGKTEFTVGASTTSSVTDALSDPLVLGIIGIVAIGAIGGAYYFLRKKKA
jgi:hypothetical protein